MFLYSYYTSYIYQNPMILLYLAAVFMLVVVHEYLCES